jgi:hypothetical protein
MGSYTDLATGERVLSDEQDTLKHYLRGVCFFDALYACAFYEAAELSLEGHTTEDITAMGTEHYYGFARAQGIPFDEAGMPVPAARGRPLMEGKFEPGAFEVAKLTKDIPLELDMPEDHLPKISAQALSLPDFGAAAPANPKDALSHQGAHLKSKFELVKATSGSLQKIDRTNDTLTSLKERFNEVLNGKHKAVNFPYFNKREFLTGRGDPGANVGSGAALASFAGVISFLIGGVTTDSMSGGLTALACTLPIGLIPPSIYLIKEAELTAFRRARLLQKFRAQARKYPDGFKEPMFALADNIELGTAALKARKAIKDVKKGSFREKHRARRLLAKFNTVARKQGLDEGTAENFRRAILSNARDNKFETEIHRSIDKSMRELRQALSEHGQSVKEAAKLKEKQLENHFTSDLRL